MIKFSPPPLRWLIPGGVWEELFNHLSLHSPDGIAVVEGKNLVIRFANPQFRHILDIDVQRVEDRSLWEVVPGYEIPKAFEEAIKDSKVVSREVEYIGNSKKVLDVRVAPIRRRLALGLIIDRTKIKELEEMSKTLLDNVSHELRTPLTSIVGYTEMLLDRVDPKDEKTVKYLAIVSSEAHRLMRLIEKILTITRIERGKIHIEKSRVNLIEIVENVFQLMLPLAEDKDIEMKVNIRDQIVFVEGNSDQLKQVLINLIDNAIKYTEPGGEITIEVGKEGNSAFIAVQDTGPGIPRDKIDKIFEKFYRVDRTKEGLGLGLALVKAIVDAHNGWLKVESKVGVGSRFTVYLPLKQ